jgi:polyphosphate glucokinase
VTAPSRRVLVIDIGGSHVKLRMTGQRTMTRFDSGPTMRPSAMVRGVKAATAEWEYDVISIGLPGPVADDTGVAAPHNLGPGWVGFDFAAAFDRKVRVINDAAMQALGGYRGGRMLFLGLGTGLGAAFVIDGIVQPLELAHLPYRKDDTFEDVVCGAARKQVGNRRWRHDVLDVVAMLRFAMQAESVLIGGGNVKHLEAVAEQLPADTRLGGNSDAFRGGLRLWDTPLPRKRRAR